MLMLKKRRAFMTLLLSNSLILCLSIIISTFTCVNVMELAKDEIKKYYDVEAKVDKLVIDSALKNINEVLYKLSTNEKVIEISKYKTSISLEQYLTAAQGYKDFAFFEFNSMVEDMYIVFPQSDLVVRNSGCNNMRDYYNIYLTEKAESYDKFENMILNSKNKKFILSDNGKDVFCVNSLFPEGNANRVAVVVIDLNEKLLFPHMDGEGDSHFLIYEKAAGRLVPVIGLAKKKIDIDEVLKTNTYKIDKKQYFVTSIDSSQYSWKYVYLINMSKLVDRMTDIRLSLMLGIWLTIILGVLLLPLLTKKQYKPIEEIVSTLKNKIGEDVSYASEYEYIGSVVERFSEEFKPGAVMTREKSVKELGLFKQLRGEENNEEVKKIIEGSLRKKNYMVAIFIVEETDELFFEKAGDKSNESSARFIVGNVFRDILGCDFEVEVCEPDNIIFIIGSDDINCKNEIYNRLFEGQNIVEKNFNLKFSVMLSQFHSGKESLSQCYSEATECLSYRIFSNSGIVHYEEISNIDFSVGYFYTTEHEKSLSNYLKMANREAAKKLMDEILDFNLRGEASSPMSFKCIIYDIIGTVVKTIYELEEGGEEFLKNLEIFEKIEKCNTIPKTREFLTEIIYDCCNFINSSPKKPNEKIIEHIKAFVALNYGDINLCISMIAEKFDMNANYLSTLFKKKNGISLLNYITVIRMEKAKEILKNEHMKLEKVALCCGYDNIRTFSRAFTNNVGISPGKYRDEM